MATKDKKNVIDKIPTANYVYREIKQQVIKRCFETISSYIKGIKEKKDWPNQKVIFIFTVISVVLSATSLFLFLILR